MKAKVIDLNGKEKEEIELPAHFEEEVRPDLIKRAVLAIQSHRIQPYGTYKLAGIDYAIELSKRRRAYKSVYGRGISRVPRKVLSRKGGYFHWVGAFAPHTVGGRVAHPPKVEKVWAEKINKKENRKAIRSAIAATAIKEFVLKRGHKAENVNVPIVIEEKIEELKKAKEVENLLKTIGLKEELERAKEKKVRAGKGKMRGRRYKKKVGPLFVVSDKCSLMKAAKNIAGADVIQVKDLNAEVLAPGAQPGRLVIWSKPAIEKLNSLFM